MSSFFKHRIILLRSPKVFIPVLLVIYFIYAYATAKPEGYCEAEKRVITKEEMCANYLEAMIKFGLLKQSASETTGRDYLGNHPDSCRGHRITAWDRFMNYGPFAPLVEARMNLVVTYEMSDLDRKRRGATTSTHYTAALTLDACGGVLTEAGIAE
ncbi:MAG: hypothetical protein ACYC3A_08310 [Halothiobacillus sp.]